MSETIKMGVNYWMFDRMVRTAAYMEGTSNEYINALWEYFSSIGEIDDALQFFDNLFQNTDWFDTIEEIIEHYGADDLVQKDEDGEILIDKTIEKLEKAKGVVVYQNEDGFLVLE